MDAEKEAKPYDSEGDFITTLLPALVCSVCLLRLYINGIALKNQHQCTHSLFFRHPLKFHLSFLHLVLKYLRSLGLAMAFDSTKIPSMSPTGVMRQVPPPRQLKCQCTLTSKPRRWVVNEASPLFYERREESAWKPESVTHCQYPEDGQLVQHLANETKSHVEVSGEETCNKINNSEMAFVNGIHLNNIAKWERCPYYNKIPDGSKSHFSYIHVNFSGNVWHVFCWMSRNSGYKWKNEPCSGLITRWEYSICHYC